MLPQEIVELGFEKVPDSNMGLKQIILMENMRPFIADKIIYYKDPAFMNRVQYSIDNIPEIPLLDLSSATPLNNKIIKSDNNEENTIRSTTTDN